MSALNVPGNLNVSFGLESHGNALQRIPVSLGSRTVCPSFMPNYLSVGQSENVSINLATPVLSSGYGTATGSQSFTQMANVTTGPWDRGQIVFHNASVGAFAGSTSLIVGHPQFQLVDGQGLVYPSGMLRTDYAHQGLGVQVSVPVFLPTGLSAPASITLNVSGMLLGMAQNH